MLNKRIELSALRRNGEEFSGRDRHLAAANRGGGDFPCLHLRYHRGARRAEARIQKLNGELTLRADQLEVANRDLEAFFLFRFARLAGAAPAHSRFRRAPAKIRRAAGRTCQPA